MITSAAFIGVSALGLGFIVVKDVVQQKPSEVKLATSVTEPLAQ